MDRQKITDNPYLRIIEEQSEFDTFWDSHECVFTWNGMVLLTIEEAKYRYDKIRSVYERSAY